MKTLTLFLSIVIFISLSAQAETLQDLQKKMQPFKVEDFTVTAKNPKAQVSQKFSEVYKLLQDASEKAIKGKEKPSQEFFNSYVRLASYTYNFEKSLVVNDFIPDLLKKFPKEMKKAIDTLPEDKKKILNEDIKNIDTEDRVGNG